MTFPETTTPSTGPETASQSCDDDPLAIPDFLRRVSGDLKIELHYAYPTSTHGGPFASHRGMRPRSGPLTPGASCR